MRRFAVLGLHHETNTFAAARADQASYRAGGLWSGEALRERFGGSRATVGGFLADPAAVPLTFAMVNPCGPVSAEAYDAVVGELCGSLADTGPYDGVLLALHGACVADGHPSADADIAAAVRAVVGPDVPIGTVLDLHANLDPRLADSVDVIVAYRTNPHVDASEQAIRCRAVLDSIVATGRRPATAIEQIPLLTSMAHQDTSSEPMAGLQRRARELTTESGAIDVSILVGFPYADVPQLGMAVVATHADDTTARRVAATLAAEIWDERESLQGGAVEMSTAVTAARDHRGDKPLLLLDIGDNIGAGAPGDTTALFAPLLDARAVTTCCDPSAIAALRDHEPGDDVRVDLGADGLEVAGRLTGRHRGRFRAQAQAHGGFSWFDGGELVSLTTPSGSAVVVTERPVQPVTPSQLTVVGLDPTAFRVIIAKGVNGPLAGYADVCDEHLAVDTPGITRDSIQNLSYHHRRPLYPFERDLTYRPSTDLEAP